MEHELAMTIEQLDDRTLIAQSQNGDKRAFGLLVKRYMQRAYYSALGLVGSHDGALDLSQEAFIRAYRALNNFDPDKRFFTWYYHILRNLCFNFLRDRAKHARTFSEVGTSRIALVGDGTEASDNVEREELRKAVWNALEDLRDQEREIIILKDFQELSYKEIAEVLACPIGTVMSRLFNARKALKAKLEKYL